MTVETTLARAQYATNGTTGPWTVNFYFLEDAHLQVIYTDADGNETVLGLGAGYSVTGAGDENGGTVTTTTAYASGGYITILRSIEPLQETDLVDGDSLPAETLETALDKLTMLAQQTLEVANRALVFSPSDATGSTLPAATARADKLLSFDSNGAVSLVAPVAGTATALALSLASSANASSGAGLIGYDATRAYAANTVGAKLRELVSVVDLGADKTGVADSTAAFQAAITAGSVYVPPGTYALTGNISIPGSRKIWIQKGATVTNTGGRFTAENVEGVEWHIDGWLKSVSMTTAASKPLWTASPDERGFIEFAQNYVAASAARGFWVHGTGKVSGDWTGTPNVSDIPFQINRKGIACWNAANVLVEGLEVFGFDGEAIYASFFDGASSNIVFRNNSVYNTRFNALNFNAGANGGGCVIRNNKVDTAYQLETSVGDCLENTIYNTVSSGIFTGSGAGSGPVTIRGNIIQNSGLHSITAAYASGTPVAKVIIEENISIAPQQYGIFVDYIREFSISDNVCIGSGTGAGAYDIGVNNSLRGVVSGNMMTSPGGFAVGTIAPMTTCFDVSVDSSNRFIATTGTAPPTVDGGVTTLASAGTLTLPAIGSVFSVTGTTNITSIVATSNSGREVTLIFTNALTFTDGSNLKIAGNLVTTADDTITLVCDGTNWYEKSRSVN